MKHTTPCMQNLCSAVLHTLDSCMGTKDKNISFLNKLWCISHYAIKMFELMHTPGLWGWVKESDIEIVQISIIRLNLVT